MQKKPAAIEKEKKAVEQAIEDEVEEEIKNEEVIPQIEQEEQPLPAGKEESKSI